MNVATLLAKSATKQPDRAALRYDDVETSYAELHRRALSIGGELLARGLVAGDRVVFAMHNRPEVLEVIYGCFAAGLVVVPLNARLHPLEMAYIAKSSGARAFVHGPEFEGPLDEHWTEFAGVEHRIGLDCSAALTPYAPLLNSDHALTAPVKVEATDPCWLFFTSGTTGFPKGATWTHRSTLVMIMNWLADVMPFGGEDVVLHCAPLSHGSGIVALPAIARGATNVILSSASFDPNNLFEHVQRLRVTYIAFMAPTQIVKTLDEVDPSAYDLSTLKMVCYGGAPIYVEHIKKAVQDYGPIWVQIFGQGEAPMTATVLPAAEHEALARDDDPRLGSAGFARTDVEVRIVDADDNPLPPGQPGEICVRGDVVMASYWGDPEATAEALRGGWLHMGDVGMFDEHGYLHLLDRTKDMIISGGNNVYPREVEEVLITHPSVHHVVVVGIPDDYWGEAVHAVVVVEPGTSPTPAELIAHCGTRLAGYKKPKAVDFVDELPVSAYGKVLRREVRARYWGDRERAVAGGR